MAVTVAIRSKLTETQYVVSLSQCMWAAAAALKQYSALNCSQYTVYTHNIHSLTMASSRSVYA